MDFQIRLFRSRQRLDRRVRLARVRGARVVYDAARRQGASFGVEVLRATEVCRMQQRTARCNRGSQLAFDERADEKSKYVKCRESFAAR